MSQIGKKWSDTEVGQLIAEVTDMAKDWQSIVTAHRRTEGGLKARLKIIAWEWHSKEKLTIDEIVKKIRFLPREDLEVAFRMREEAMISSTPSTSSTPSSIKKKVKKKDNNLTILWQFKLFMKNRMGDRFDGDMHNLFDEFVSANS